MVPTVSNQPGIPSSAPPSTDHHPLFPHRKPLTTHQISHAIQTCLELQDFGVTEHSKRPFAALLLGPAQQSHEIAPVLLTHLSISHIDHAESSLARLASVHFGQEYLWRCTLVTTWEPCAMCTGTIYWANIGRIVYAAGEDKLKDVTGPGNDENMTMSLPCRDVLTRGQKDVEVIGPLGGDYGDWEGKVMEESRKWWKVHGGGGSNSSRSADA